jgi:hypothetical protein
MHGQYVEKLRRMWQDPETRKKMLAGAHKGTAILKSRSQQAKQESTLRMLRTKKLKQVSED